MSYFSANSVNDYRMHVFPVLIILILYIFLKQFFILFTFAYISFWIIYFYYYIKYICRSISIFKFSIPYMQKNIDNFISLQDIYYDTEECVICLESFSISSRPYKIRCPCQNYSYHKYCIKEWFLIHPECPLCRKNISIRSNFL